jgi:hypothetical protein
VWFVRNKYEYILKNWLKPRFLKQENTFKNHFSDMWYPIFGHVVPVFETFNYEMDYVNIYEKRTVIKFAGNTF